MTQVILLFCDYCGRGAVLDKHMEGWQRRETVITSVGILCEDFCCMQHLLDKDAEREAEVHLGMAPGTEG